VVTPQVTVTRPAASGPSPAERRAAAAALARRRAAEQAAERADLARATRFVASLARRPSWLGAPPVPSVSNGPSSKLLVLGGLLLLVVVVGQATLLSLSTRMLRGS
jgi:hypothetical protein